eukprot:7212611-Pyramimonas_sp.AAC.1
MDGVQRHVGARAAVVRGLRVGTTRTRSSLDPAPTPSNCTKNSVLSRRDASCSPEERAVRMESISSTNTIDGCRCLASANIARTIFSPCPTYLHPEKAARGSGGGQEK